MASALRYSPKKGELVRSRLDLEITLELFDG